MSGTNLDDSLGNASDLAVEEVLHLLEFKLMADQASDVHFAGGDQRDGIAEGERVDEGALDGQLLLVNVVRIHFEMRLLRADAEHQHLRTFLGGSYGLSLGRRKADGFDDYIVGIFRNLFAGGVVRFGDAELLLVTLQLFIENAGKIHLMHAVRLQKLGEDLPHETVADNQRLLIRAKFQQIETMHRA